jgi:betaine-aldehyde dehydrogenase
VQDYINDAVSQGASIVLGGGQPTGLTQGYFVAPTLLDDVRNDMRIAQEEVFGPVISVITYRNEDEAVGIANDSIYGLSGAIYTENIERGYSLARRIRTGTVSVNGLVIDFTLPFGGYKQSGIGREGGIEGLEEFLEVKTVHMPSVADTH